MPAHVRTILLVPILMHMSTCTTRKADSLVAETTGTDYFALLRGD